MPDVADIQPSDILLVRQTTREFVPLVQRAAGLIVAEGGLDSHAANMAVELGLVAIVGAEGALSRLHDGQAVTLDPLEGVVYEGHMRK